MGSWMWTGRTQETKARIAYMNTGFASHVSAWKTKAGLSALAINMWLFQTIRLSRSGLLQRYKFVVCRNTLTSCSDSTVGSICGPSVLNFKHANKPQTLHPRRLHHRYPYTCPATW